MHAKLSSRRPKNKKKVFLSFFGRSFSWEEESSQEIRGWRMSLPREGKKARATAEQESQASSQTSQTWAVEERKIERTKKVQEKKECRRRRLVLLKPVLLCRRDSLEQEAQGNEEGDRPAFVKDLICRNCCRSEKKKKKQQSVKNNIEERKEREV